MKQTNLSIIIVNYNTFELTAKCVESIVAETKGISYEIIVVDNASDEFDGNRLKELSPDLTTIINPTNFGFGIANNSGMETAKGEYILLLNSDTIIINNGIEKSLKYLLSNPTIDVLTCQQLNEKKELFVPQSFYYKTDSIWQYLLRNPIFELIKSKIKRGKSEFLTENNFVNNVSGAFMLFKKNLFVDTKGFDPDFFIYYEETEWCSRIRKKGYKLFFLNDVSFIHLHGKSSPRAIMQKQMHLSGGLYWYKKGYFIYFLFLVISYFVYVPQWMLLSLFSIKAKTRKHFFKYVKMYWALIGSFFFIIPQSNNKFGLRKSSLRLRDLD